jgi:NAD(P)-dependent dehydrogenase (short-subunit alcohol dehydrogenase family)
VQILDRVAMITGGKRIGATVAVELARLGADVVLTWHTSHAAAEETAVAVRAAGRRALIVQTDVRVALDCGRAVEATVSAFGRLDVLVNMASVYVAKPFDDLEEADWDEQLNVDLRGTYCCSRAAVPHMRLAGGGRIINFSDWVSRSGRPRYLGFLPYYVAKSGIIALTEALALELARDRILVNAIAPGPIVPPEGTSQEQVDRIARSTPLGRWGGGQEIAKAVIALVESDFLTGETIRVDGGKHLK